MLIVWPPGWASAPATTSRLASANRDAKGKGNPYVRRLLCEFAHAASRTRCALQSKFQALVVRRGRKRAIIGLAHKMLRTIFFMLSRGQPYRDSATDYEALNAKRNAPRWIRTLRRFGFLPVPA